MTDAIPWLVIAALIAFMAFSFGLFLGIIEERKSWRNAGHTDHKITVDRDTFKVEYVSSEPLK